MLIFPLLLANPARLSPLRFGFKERKLAKKSTLNQPETFSKTFTFSAPENSKTVSLAGTFNNWNATAMPMNHVSGTTIWRLTLQLPAGEYQYKFVVNGSQWMTDPKAINQSDGSGNVNSITWVFPPDYKTPAEIGDGKITYSAIEHKPELPYLNWDRSYEGGLLQVELRLRPNDVQSVWFIKNGQVGKSMSVLSTDPVYQYDVIRLPWHGDKPFRYGFKIQDGATVRYFGPEGFTRQLGKNQFDLSKDTVPSLNPPHWVQHTIFYQIFPDRFSNNNPAEEDSPDSKWNQTKALFGYAGGNIAGMESHLDYLKSLGISGIYFNPIFKSTVYHGYETSDYLQIDPHYGSNEEFADLTLRLKSAGIRTVLDGVFNHTSTKFFAFQDVVKHGEASPYLHWYTFYGFPVQIKNNPNYKAWDNYPSMPKLNHHNPGVIHYLLNVPSFWNQHASIAGWRLDAAQEVSNQFWRKFHHQVKSINPNDWIVGEDWGDSSSYLNNNLWDSVMNYPFLFAVWNFVGQKGSASPSVLANTLMQVYGWYTPQSDRNMMNLIDSHDTIRILTECGGDSALRNIAATLEFAWVGAPTIYYGDELGMAGGKDPDNRNPMEWYLDHKGNPTLAFYKSLIKARNASPELQMGRPEFLLTNDKAQTLAFARIYQKKAALCIVNRSNQEQLLQFKLPENIQNIVLEDAISGKSFQEIPGGTWRSIIAPKTAMLLVPEKELEPRLLILSPRVNTNRKSPSLPSGTLRIQDGGH